MCRKSEHYQFVENLFATTKEPREGIYIRMADNSIIRVSLFENNNKVEVSMNGAVMGYFEPMTERGYEYCFHQKYRTGIKNGYTSAEKLMANICELHSDKILFHRA